MAGEKRRRRPGTVRQGGATISDVATAAGVSRATVSRVVNGLDTVDAELAVRVRRAVDQLGYSPSTTARSLSIGRTNMVGVVVPDLRNPMFQHILRGVTHAAAVDGYRVLVSDAQENPRLEPELAREARTRADALVLCAPRMDAHHLDTLLAALGPAVVINRTTTAASVPAVTVDYVSGIRALAEHLVDLGHRHLLYLEGPPESASNAARRAGLVQFAQDHPDIVLESLACGSSMDDGYQAWPGVRSTAATAVLAFNDVVALGLLGRLHEEGVAVPGRLSVAGFDDIEYARFSTPPLTTMAVPQTEIGAVAWQQLRARLGHQTARAETTFRPELIVRRSTGRRP